MQAQANPAYKLPEEVKQAWRPPEEIMVPDWVEKNVRLPRFTSAEPGPLRISRTPYTRGPLFALGSPFIEWIVLVWGRQLGKSQGVQYAFLCYCIDQDPGPAIHLLPTIDKSKYTSKKRLQPMFNACEAVRNEKTDNPDDFTLLEMQFKRMILSMAWGGSDTQLTTRPARYLFRDEVDELKKTVGQNAVDPMKAIEQTTSNFPNKKIVDASTPTSPEGNIWQELKTCQYVFEYWIPCPHCEVLQILYWENVRFGDDHDPIVVEENAYYECEACQDAISNLDKIRMLAKGEWRARTSPDPCEQIMKNVRARIEETISLDEALKNRRIKKIGFHLPKWYSPFAGGTFGVIAKEFLEADKVFREGEDFALMRNWRMYNAARPWEEVAPTKSEVELMANKIDIPALVCPKETIALTCGFDPGQGGFWFAVIAWRRPFWPHLLHYGFLQDWTDIEALLENYYPTHGEKDIVHPIWRAGIDTGGSQYEAADTTMTAAAYDWLRRFRRPGLYGTKGMSHPSTHSVKSTKIDKYPDGKPIPGGLVLWEINTWAIKDKIRFHLGIEQKKDEPPISIKDLKGKFTFHSETDRTFFSQLLAEEKRMQKNGKWDWVRIRTANHLLDCTVIAFALADPEAYGGIMVLRPPEPRVEKKEDKEKGNWVMGKEKRQSWIKGK